MVRNSNRIDEFLAQQRFGKVLKLVQSGRSGNKSILDIGCGETGGILPRAEGFSQRHGCDRLFSSPHRKGNVAYRPVDLESDNLPYNDNQFDFVTCTAVIEHLDRKSADRVFSEAFRVLKPGSTLVVTTPAPHTQKLQELLAKAKLISQAEIDEHKQLFSLPELRQMAENAGFHKVDASSWQFGLNQVVHAKKPFGSPRAGAVTLKTRGRQEKAVLQAQ